MISLAAVAEIAPGMARTGRGAGARAGDWEISLVESRNIRTGWLDLDDLRRVAVVRNAWSERHLLRPYDVLVTARAESAQVALVPARVSRTAAAGTALVVRAPDPGSGLAHWLWLYLSSTPGRARIAGRRNAGAAAPLLSAANLGALEVPVPPAPILRTIPAFVEASETAYEAGVRAAALRRGALADAFVAALEAGARPGGDARWP